LRVAHVLPAFFQDQVDFMGGGDRYAYQLSKALRPYADVTFFTFGPRHREASFDGVRHIVLPIARHGNPDNPLPGSLDFASNRFDIVHCYHLRTVVTNLATLVRRAMRKPLIVTDLGGGGRSASIKFQLYRLIPAYTCISDFSRSLLPAAAQPKAVVVKGGIELERFPYDPTRRQRQVLQVGRLMPHKGMNYVIEALGDQVSVVIAGKVVSERYYRDLRKLAEGKQVRFLIDAADGAILAEYRRSAVTVAASVYRDMYGGFWPTSELLGLPLLESMSVGTPVVCSDVGGMPEFVRDGETGFVIPPNDVTALRERVLALLGEPARAAQLGKAGHEHVQQFGFEHVAHQVAAEYTKLLDRS
jgi:glycosyltransferase involved in cell wall biosynthesis